MPVSVGITQRRSGFEIATCNHAPWPGWGRYIDWHSTRKQLATPDRMLGWDIALVAIGRSHMPPVHAACINIWAILLQVSAIGVGLHSIRHYRRSSEVHALTSRI